MKQPFRTNKNSKDIGNLKETENLEDHLVLEEFYGQFLQQLTEEANQFFNDGNLRHQSYLIRDKYLNKVNNLFSPPYSAELNRLNKCGNYQKRMSIKINLR